MTAGQRLEFWSAQVVGHQGAKILLVLRRRELFHQRNALGVGDSVRYVPAQGALAQGRDTAAQMLEHRIVVQAGKLAAEAVQVAKHTFVDDADQTEELKQRVL